MRRKTIRNSIRPLLGNGMSIEDTTLLDLRPEQLSVEKFVELTNHIITNQY